MARRFPIVSSVVFLLAFFVEATVFAATYNAGTVSGLNAIFNQTGADAVVNDDVVTLTITEQEGVWREWRNTDAMNGLPGVNFTLIITKNGAGNWRLGEGTPMIDPITGAPFYMTNILDSGAGANTFNINAGIVDLMNGTTISMTGGAGSGFLVAGGASLNARGANTVTTAGPLTLQNNSTLGFDLTNFATGTPILTIAGVVPALTDPADRVNINLLGFRDVESAGPTVTLLQYNYEPVTQEGAAAPDPPPLYAGLTVPGPVNARPDRTVNLLVRGEDWDLVTSVPGSRLGGQFQQGAVADGTTSLILTGFYSNIGTVTWTGNTATGDTGRTWNATASNWTGAGSTFLHGDTVIFGPAAPAAVQDILVQAGGVQIGGVQASGPTEGVVGTMTVSGGNYSFTNAGGGTIGIDGQGSVIVTGGLTRLDFNSANSYWGGTRIENGMLTARNAHALGTGTVRMLTPGVLIFDISDPVAEVWNNISGDSGSIVVKMEAGDLYLRGAAGAQDTVVYEGTLFDSIGTGVLTVYGGATYDSVNRSRSIAGLHDEPRRDPIELGITAPTEPSGDVIMGTGRLSINVAGVNESYTFSGTISGSAILGVPTLTKDGLGTQILTGDSPNLEGGTLVRNGRLVIQRVLDGSQDIYPLGMASPTNSVEVGADGILQFDLSGRDTPDLIATFGNAIRGEGTILKSAFPERDSPRSIPSVLCLTSGDSDYTGLTIIQEGSLRLEHREATGQTVEVQLAADTTLQFARLSDFPGVLEGNSDRDAYDRLITGNGGVEVMTGTTVYVSGTNSDEARGNDPRPVPRATASNYRGETTVHDNATLHILNAEATGATSQVFLVTNTSNLSLDFDQDQVYDRHITGAGNVQKTGVGIATLAYPPTGGENNYLGTTTVRNGTLRLMYARATGADDAALQQSVEVEELGILELAFDGTYNKGIWGRGGIAKSEEGTTTVLNRRNSYTGGTYIWGGTLSFTDTNTVSGSGNLGTGGVYFQQGGGTLQNTAENPAFTQQIVIEGGSTAIFDTQADIAFVGTSRVAHAAAPDPDIADPRSHFVKMGGADLTIANEVGTTWTGRTVVEDGRLINNIPIDTELTVNTPGEYLTGNNHRQVSLLEGDGIVRTYAGFDFTVNNGVDNVFDGSVMGDGNLVKTGQGLFTLAGDNSYRGETVVKEGTLRGNIPVRTALVVEGRATYESGGANRAVRSLAGSGIVDMQNRSLTINMEGSETVRADFYGRILNGELLQKYGAGTQVLGGTSYEFRNNVLVHEGTLQIGADSTGPSVFRTAGDLSVAPNGTFAINPYAQVIVDKTLTVEGTFSVDAGNNNIVRANDVLLGPNSTINIAGITTAEPRTIIQSQNEFDSRFAHVTVAGDPSTNVDYLIFGVYYEPTAVKVGQTLRWYSDKDAHGTFTLTNPDPQYSYTVHLPLQDVTDSSKWDKTVGWDGKTLTKEGPGTLILAAKNEYTGATEVNAGTLRLAHADATLGSSGVILGDNGTLELDFDGSMKTSITGTGLGVDKIGDSVSVLTGPSWHFADTTVRGGTLYVDDLLYRSQVWVEAGAGFGGKGTVNKTVTFYEGSFFDWRFGRTESQSDMLTVGGVQIGKDVWVRPNTNIPLGESGTLSNIDGWKILFYDGELNNEFAGVVNGANPYYDFTLDYGLDRYVRINGFLRDEPHPLSDIVATSLMMAQTKMYRTAYQQIAREWASDCPDHPVAGRQVRGQAHKFYRTPWMNFIGRGEQYASTHFDDKYQLQAYGVQVGVSVLANCRNSFGIMYGREESKLSNSSDTARGEDNYLGLYYGHGFETDIDFRGYIGGGWQHNRIDRNSNGNLYHVNYGGNTFNIDAEFGRRFLTERLWTLRPFLGFDLAVSRIGSGTETCKSNPTSNEYRSHRRASLAQFLTRAGFEVSKDWRMFDFNSGLQLAWNWADTDPSVRIYYPVTGGSVRSHAADIGRFSLGMNVGFNWYITPQRHTMFYLNYIGDVHLDRHGTGGNTGYVGFLWKF